MYESESVYIVIVDHPETTAFLHSAFTKLDDAIDMVDRIAEKYYPETENVYEDYGQYTIRCNQEEFRAERLKLHY